MFGQVCQHVIKYSFIMCSDCIALVLNYIKLYQTITLHSPLSYRIDVKIVR